MQIAEYYDSVASIWDDDYAEAKAARIVTAMVSIQRGGACVMDVGHRHGHGLDPAGRRLCDGCRLRQRCDVCRSHGRRRL